MADPNVCVYCKTKVFFAEQQRHETGLYHAKCFTKYSKDVQQQQKSQLWGSNLTYDQSADVQPAYYSATGGQGGRSAMISGSEYKGATSPRSEGTGGSGGSPKFCPSCGTATSGAKFCGECGTKF